MALDETEMKPEGMMNQADSQGRSNSPVSVEMKPQADLELEALSSQLVGMEAKFHELLNSEKTLIESKGKEMSGLLSELDDAEDKIPQHDCMAYETRTKETRTKRLAVTAIASELKGGRRA